MFPFTLSADQVVPRIVLELPSAAVPDMEMSGTNAPVERHLVADLSVTYAFDLPKCFKIVAKRDLDTLALHESQVHDLAMRNLSERMRKLEPEFLESDHRVFLLRTGGDFEATALLFDDVWEQAASMVCGELVVSVPARDIVAFTGGDNRDGLAFMRSHVSRILEQGDHTLTRHFLVRRGKQWIQYEGYGG